MGCALRISEAASLAFHALGLMATDPRRPRSAKAIAAGFAVSEAHLSKVLQRLTKDGLLVSSRGPRGGFTLAKESGKVTLLEIFEAIEGPMEHSDCLLGSRLCDGSGCVLGTMLGEINELLWEHLSSTTLADVGAGFRKGLVNFSNPPPKDR